MHASPDQHAHQARILAASRTLYTRVLSQWAMDLLMLRRDGLDVPSKRSGDSVLTLPEWTGVASQRAARWGTHAAPRWKPARRAA